MVVSQKVCFFNCLRRSRLYAVAKFCRLFAQSVDFNFIKNLIQSTFLAIAYSLCCVFVLCFHPNIFNCFSFFGAISSMKLSQCDKLISKQYLSFKKIICSSISVREIKLARFNISNRIKRSLVKTLFASEKVIDFKKCFSRFRI